MARRDPERRRLGRRARRSGLLVLAGLALITGALLVRSSPWARERQLRGLSSHSLSLLALERPDDPLVLQQLGRHLYEDNDLRGSVQAFATAAELNPNLADAHLGLGIALLDADQPYDAERSLVRAAELRPKDPRPHFKLAQLYARYRNSTATIPPLEKVVELDPGDAEAWYQLGMAWGDLHQFDRSLDALEQAARLNRRRAIYLRDLGQVQLYLARIEAARRSLDLARDIEPRDPGTLVLLADLEMSQGSSPERLQAAEALLRQTLRLDPHYAPAYRELGAIYLRRRDALRAVAVLRQAVRYDPTDGQALFQLGQALIRAGRREEGQRMIKGFEQLSEARRTVSQLEDRIHQDARNPELRLRIARVYRRYGRDDRAVNQYQVYLSMKPADGQVRQELDSYLAGLRRSASRNTGTAGKQ